MGEIQSNYWLVFLRRNSPNLVSLIIAALIAMDLVRIFSMLAGPAINHAPLSPNAHQQSKAISRTEVNQIIAAHLFGILNSDQNASEATLHKSSSDLAIVGTIATQNPQRGMAIIGDQGEFKVYSVGERIGDASLHSVYLDHVILDRHGTLEILALPRELSGTEHLMADSPYALQASAKDASIQAQQAIPIIDRVADSDTESDGEGKMLGIRVVPGKDIATFNHSGLKGGDVIVAVNGSKLDTTDRSQDIWKQVSTGTTVTVIRWGKTQDVTLNFAP